MQIFESSYKQRFHNFKFHPAFYYVQVAIVVMDEKVGDRINALNSAKYQTKKKQERLQELKTQNKSTDSGDSSSNNQNESDDAQVCKYSKFIQIILFFIYLFGSDIKYIYE